MSVFAPRLLQYALPLMLGIFLAACAAPLTPEQVTDRFWRAVVAQQPMKIARYVTARDRARLDRDSEILPVENYELGRIVIDGSTANVTTRVTLAGDTPVTIAVDTRLVQEESAWLVDYQTTVENLSAQGELARVIAQIGAIGETVQRGIDQSAEDMKKALPAIERELARIEEAIRQRVPELRSRLEAFAKQLEEALKRPPTDDAPPESVEPPPEGTIAL
ncbi:MAG: hypothetical protein WD928_13265 [Gammaproteobacteria bacterium]